MRRHRVIAACLHLVASLFVAACVSTIWIGAVLLAPLFDGSFVPALLAAVGRPVGFFLLGVALVDALAAIVLIARPSTVAGLVLVIVGLPLLFVFPIGTALAGYTAWALWWRPSPDAFDVATPRLPGAPHVD